ncbi:MAG: hypothetical protein FJ308_21455 [Planctomycetes bacterium]|nr:hypothetical protein [Planctomycetota bacterium]
MGRTTALTKPPRLINYRNRRSSAALVQRLVRPSSRINARGIKLDYAVSHLQICKNSLSLDIPHPEDAKVE